MGEPSSSGTATAGPKPGKRRRVGQGVKNPFPENSLFIKTANQPRNRTDKLRRPCKRKTDMNIGSWNVLSWYRPGAALNAIQQMEKSHMDITAVQEVRWPDTGNVKMSKSVVFFSGSPHN